jgi:hypothetical protein
MNTSLKYALLAAGVVVGGVIVYKVLAPTPQKAVAPPVTQYPPPLRPPPAGASGRDIEMGVATWTRETAARAANIIAAEWNAMGEPKWDPQAEVELAWAAANEIWPQGSWPTNPVQSNLFLQSADPGTPVWGNLLTLAQDQLGYRPIT